MKHCHISILCNELIFLKHKLPFLYKHFSQLIFVDYNIISKGNSTDGSIEFIENFKDIDNKITLIKNFNPSEISIFHGESFVEKQKMFAKASTFVNNNINIVWATDLDEFFNVNLIKDVEELYIKDSNLVSIDLPHRIFVYNEHNVYDKDDFYIAPRITKHKINNIYGHCDFQRNGKTIKYKQEYLYHFAFVGFERCLFKFDKIYSNKNFNHINWLNEYMSSFKENKKYIKLQHSNTNMNLYSKPYIGSFPDYLNVNLLCKELNNNNNLYFLNDNKFKKKYNSAYILSHNGLGDNITMIGAINYLSNYYESVNLLCKEKYLDNISTLINNKNIKLIPINHRDEFNDCAKIINNISKDQNNDIFICGCHKNYLVSRINNFNIKNYNKTKNYVNDMKWEHIEQFYNDINLDLTIYYEYFDIKSSDKSMYFYNKVKHLKLIFCHTESSNKMIDISSKISEYMNDSNYLIVCANKNLYDKNNKYYYTLANIYVNIPVQNYINIIKNSCEIYVIDSCFACIIHPLNVCKKLKANNVEIISRN